MKIKKDGKNEELNFKEQYKRIGGKNLSIEQKKPLNEAVLKEGTHYIKTDRFGEIGIIVEENVTISDKTESLNIQINYAGGSAGKLGSFLIEGQLEPGGDLKPKSKAQVKFKKGKTQVTLP